MIENNLMSSLALDGNIKMNSRDYILIQRFIKKYLKRIKTFNKCLVLKKPTFDISDSDKFNMYFGDETGFECSQNELNLNVEFKKDLISKEFAKTFFCQFNKALKRQFADRIFCSIMSMDNKSNWVFRFHIVRAKDGLWIDENIEGYNVPIIYDIF